MPGTVHQAGNKVYVLNVPENAQFQRSPCQTQWAFREFLGSKKKNERSKPAFLIFQVYVILKIRKVNSKN